MANTMTPERLEKLCRQACEELGLDPETIMTSKFDSYEVKSPRWQTFATKVTEIHINKVIFDVITKEANATISG